MAEKDETKVVTAAEGTDHGYIGVVGDPTPNEAYTVAGVTAAAEPEPGHAEADEPKPKTEPKAKAAPKS